MDIKAFATAVIAFSLFGSATAIAQDTRTKRCEIRPSCAIYTTENGKCPPDPPLEGGTCVGGLLQGTVVRRNSAGLPAINRFQGGKLTGIFLNPVNTPSDSSGSKTFSFLEIDANAKLTPDGDGRNICTVYPNGTLMNGGTLTNAACARALEWLGPSNVAAVVSGTWRSNNNLPPSVPANSNGQAVAAAQQSNPSTSTNADCQAEIVKIHTESARQGALARTPLETAQAQYQYQAVPQKQLFEGRCSGHPQASAYVATANRLIADSERIIGVQGAAGTPPNRSDGDCVQPLPGGDFRNKCSFEITVTYCGLEPWGNSSLDCNKRQIGMLGLRPGGTVQTRDSRGGYKEIRTMHCPDGYTPSNVGWNGHNIIGTCR
jgi:hypothetical protein